MAGNKTERLTARFDPAENNAAAESLNVWRQNGEITPRPAFRATGDGYAAGENSVFIPCGEEKTAGGEKYRLAVIGERAETADTLKFLFMSPGREESLPDYTAEGSVESCAVYGFGGALYCLSRESGGNRALMLPPGGESWEAAEPYVPAVRRGIRMSGEAGAVADRAKTWENGESVNLLCRRYRAFYVFASANDNFSLELPYPVYDANGDLPAALYGEKITAVLTVNGGKTVSHSVVLSPDYAAGENGFAADGLKMRLTGRNLCFSAEEGRTAEEVRALFAPDTDTAEVTAPLPAGYAEKNESLVYPLTRALRFGGLSRGGEGSRLFLYGGSSAGTLNLIAAGAEGNPLYFPVSGLCRAGESSEPVTALGRQDGSLFAFKESEIYKLVPGAEGGSFYAEEASSAAGCAFPGTLCRCGNRLVWLASSGEVCALVRKSGGEYAVHAVSGPLRDSIARACAGASDPPVCGVWRDRLLLFAGGYAFAANISSYGFANAGNVSRTPADPEWNVWKVPGGIAPAYCGENGLVLSFARTSGGRLLSRCVLSESEANDLAPGGEEIPVPATLVTAPFDFGEPFREKFIERGTVFLKGVAGTPVGFSFITENGEEKQPDLVLRGEAADGGTLPYRVLPAARPGYRFALKLGFAGRAGLGAAEFAARPADAPGGGF